MEPALLFDDSRVEQCQPGGLQAASRRDQRDLPILHTLTAAGTRCGGHWDGLLQGVESRHEVCTPTPETRCNGALVFDLEEELVQAALGEVRLLGAFSETGIYNVSDPACGRSHCPFPEIDPYDAGQRGDGTLPVAGSCK
jgi:hypothetical protein